MVQKRESSSIRQGQIIDAARKVIVKYGSEHVTIKRIAREVGISEANIYRHFKSKKQILSLLVADIEANLLGDLTKAGSNHSSLDGLEGILRSHLSALAQRRGVAFQIIAEIVSLGDKRLNRKVYVTIGKYISLLKDMLSQGVSAGSISGDINLEAVATLLFSSIQGLVNMWALSNYSFDLEASFTPIWENLRRILAKP